MFIKYIKEISVKKLLKKTLHNVTPSKLQASIQNVGIIVDESYFQGTETLLEQLVLQGIKKENVTILIFKDKIKKNEIFLYPAFSFKEMHWNGSFASDKVTNFIQTPFDLLIGYYDTEKSPLLLVTHHSKALFKSGFSSVNKKLFHLMISTNAENYQVFVHELFRYLRILKKIE